MKAASPATKVLVYRNCMYALQWLESERAVMYDQAHADFFLRDKSGAIYNAPAKEGDQYLWNYSNPAAARYKMDVVIGGEGGVGSRVPGRESTSISTSPLLATRVPFAVAGRSLLFLFCRSRAVRAEPRAGPSREIP